MGCFAVFAVVANAEIASFSAGGFSVIETGFHQRDVHSTLIYICKQQKGTPSL